MTDRSKQIIPDSQSVARCLDPEILKTLDLHGTFLLEELLEMLKGSSINDIDFSKFIKNSRSIGKLINVIIITENRGNSQQYFIDEISNFVKDATTELNRENSRIANSLLAGINCNLLQPDGKGWQKGKLKLCFEFIPEEPEPVTTQEKPVETQPSPLDEIRQLANELTSMTSTEQN